MAKNGKYDAMSLRDRLHKGRLKQNELIGRQHTRGRQLFGYGPAVEAETPSGSAPTTLAELATAIAAEGGTLSFARLAQHATIDDATGLLAGFSDGIGTAAASAASGATMPTVVGSGSRARVRFEGSQGVQFDTNFDITTPHLLVYLGPTRSKYLSPGTYLSVHTGAADVERFNTVAASLGFAPLDHAITGKERINEGDLSLVTGREGMVTCRAGTQQDIQNGPGDVFGSFQNHCIGSYLNGTTLTQMFGRNKRIQVTADALAGTADVFWGCSGSGTRPERATIESQGWMLVAAPTQEIAEACYRLCVRFAREAIADVATGSTTVVQFVGDSITNYLDQNYSVGHPTFFAEIAEWSDVEVVNYGRGAWRLTHATYGGSNAAARETDAAVWTALGADLPSTRRVVVNMWGSNDLALDARTGAQLYADQQAYHAQVIAAGATEHYVIPLVPRGDNFGGGVTEAAMETETAAYNTALAGSATFTGVISTARSAIWTNGAEDNATWYPNTAAGDKTHPGNLGGIEILKGVRAAITPNAASDVLRQLAIDVAVASDYALKYAAAWDFARGDYLSDSSSRVVSIPDALGIYPRDMRQATAANRPAVNADAFVFDGVNDQLVSPTLNSGITGSTIHPNLNITLFAVARFTDTDVTSRYLGIDKQASGGSFLEVESAAGPVLQVRFDPKDSRVSALAPGSTVRGVVITWDNTNGILTAKWKGEVRSVSAAGLAAEATDGTWKAYIGQLLGGYGVCTVEVLHYSLWDGVANVAAETLFETFAGTLGA